MSLKHSKIILRLDHVNRKLIHVYQDWEKVTSGSRASSSDSLMNHLLWMEEVIYFLRVTMDELISLCYLFYIFQKDKKYPSCIKVESIGQLIDVLKKPQEDTRALGQIFIDFKDWLDTFNDVTNAYKHSFINSDHNTIGKDEPCVPVLHVRYNNLENGEKFYNLSLAEVIGKFNEFYGTAIHYIKQTAPAHLSEEIVSVSATKICG